MYNLIYKQIPREWSTIKKGTAFTVAMWLTDDYTVTGLDLEADATP